MPYSVIAWAAAPAGRHCHGEIIIGRRRNTASGFKSHPEYFSALMFSY